MQFKFNEISRDFWVYILGIEWAFLVCSDVLVFVYVQLNAGECNLDAPTLSPFLPPPISESGRFSLIKMNLLKILRADPDH
jgi:hypothetical protein